MARILPLAILLLFVSSIYSGIVKREGDHGKPEKIADLSNQSDRAYTDKQGRRQYIIGGDMEIDQEEKDDLDSGNGNDRKKRAAYFKKTSKMWTKEKGVVRIPYELVKADFSTDQQGYVSDIMKFIKDNTCVEWVPKVSTDIDYVKISKCGSTNKICSAHLGKEGKMQTVCLPDGCAWPGLIAHEFGHTMGLIHEHQRSDRDTYVTVNMNNVKKDAKKAFDKKTNDIDKSPNYEPGSIMHYESTSMSKPPGTLITIKAKTGTNGTKFEKQVWARHFDYSDIVWLNTKYECQVKTPTKKVFLSRVCVNRKTDAYCTTRVKDCPNAWNQVNCRKTCKNCNE